MNNAMFVITIVLTIVLIVGSPYLLYNFGQAYLEQIIQSERIISDPKADPAQLAEAKAKREHLPWIFFTQYLMYDVAKFALFGIAILLITERRREKRKAG